MDRPRRSQRVVPTDNNTPADSPRPSHQALPGGSDLAAAAAGGGGALSTPALLHPKAHRYRSYPAVGTTAAAATLHGTYALHTGAPQATAPSWPLGRDAAPHKPQLPIAHGQALHTTFPSRMRMGVSNLVQPLPSTGDQSDPLFGRNVAVDYGGAVGSRRSGRSNANQRRYVEQVSDDDEDDDDDDDDDAPGTGPRGTGTPGTPSTSAAVLAGSSRGTPSRGAAAAAATAPPPTPPEEPDVPGQRLGQPLPANKVTVKRASRTPHVYFSDADVARAADHREMLVPIHLELETDTHRVKDSFLWNINGGCLARG